MKNNSNIIENEEGYLIIIALFILVVVTFLGISASKTSVFERCVATNDHLHKISFSSAESGSFVLSKLISMCLNDGVAPVAVADISATDPLNAYDSDLLVFDNGIINFYDMLMGYTSPGLDSTIDATLLLNQSTAQLDVARLGGSSVVVGGGAEFATGSSGAGSGSVGGVQIYYCMRSTGNIRDSRLPIVINYRKVLGVAGGL